MEKDPILNSQDFEKEKLDLINKTVIIFNANYDQVLRGDKDKAKLYSGDFIYGKPLELILKAQPELITVSFKELFNLFSASFQTDVKGPVFAHFIKKEPEPETEFLKEFLVDNPGRVFDIYRTYYNLGQDEKGKLLLTYDRYIAPGSEDISTSLIFNLRRLKNNL